MYRRFYININKIFTNTNFKLLLAFVSRCHLYSLRTSLPPLLLDKSLICIQLKNAKGRQRRCSCPHATSHQHPSGRGSNLEAACAKNKQQQQNLTMSPRIRNGAEGSSRPRQQAQRR